MLELDYYRTVVDTQTNPWILKSELEFLINDIMENDIQARDCFESIICLCVEGREVTARKNLLDAIQKEAERGYKIVKAGKGGKGV